jgi:hypothetical protein
MRPKILVPLLCSLLLFPASVAAQDARPITDVPPGPDRIVPMKLNMPAPFAGQLFDNDTALRWANWLKQYKLRLKVDVEEQKQLCLVTTTALSQELVMEKEKYSAVMKIYDAQLTQLKVEVDNPPWYRNVWVGILIGTALTSTSLLVYSYATK